MGAASTLSIGPNNLTLIREGVSGGPVAIAAAAVWTSRLSLLVFAFILTDIIASRGLFIRPLLSWLGFLVLCWFAFSSARAYRRSSREIRLSTLRREPVAACVRRVLTVFWLNPLTYLEMLFVPATVGGSFVLPVCRALFIAGLITMATASCYGYAFGERVCAPLFRRRTMLKLFDLTSCILLSSLAAAMAVGLPLRPA